MSKLRYLLVLLVVLLPQATISSASTVSLYDNAYKTVNRLMVGMSDVYSASCDYMDITESWKEQLLNEEYIGSSAIGQGVLDDFEDALANGSYSVSQETISVGGGTQSRVYILYANSGVSLYWASNGVWMNVGESATWGRFEISSQTPAGACSTGSPSSTPSISVSNQNGGISIPGNGIRNYIVSSTLANTPQDYSGFQLRTTLPPVKYVAMGDSFSSGEGVPPFEYGSDTGSNICHRSTKAYSRLLQNDPSLDVGATRFVACSGATTNNVLNGQNGEPPQVDALSADTEIVTITVGGNDVGFKGYVTGCTIICGPGSPTYNATINTINSLVFENDLDVVFRKILEEAPNAEVYVMDYPYVSAVNATDCGVFDFRGARSIQVALNAKIADVVFDINELRLH